MLVCSAIISFWASSVTNTEISISPSSNNSFTVFSPSARTESANSADRVTVPFSIETPSVSSVPARPPPMRTATASDLEFVLIIISSPFLSHVMLVCSAMISFISTTLSDTVRTPSSKANCISCLPWERAAISDLPTDTLPSCSIILLSILDPRYTPSTETETICDFELVCIDIPELELTSQMISAISDVISFCSRGFISSYSP